MTNPNENIEGTISVSLTPSLSDFKESEPPVISVPSDEIRESVVRATERPSSGTTPRYRHDLSLLTQLTGTTPGKQVT